MSVRDEDIISSENDQVLNNFALLFSSMEFADFNIRVEDKIIKTHRCVLAAQSPYFDAMFQNDYKECESNQLVIKDQSYEVIDAMLQYMYSGKVPEISNFAEDLLKAADQYLLPHLKLICEKECVKCIMTIEDIVHLFRISDTYHAPNLKREAVRWIKMNYKDVKTTVDWEALPRDVAIAIIDILLS